MKKEKNRVQERVDHFLDLFKQELPSVRKILANDLPAYNILLSLNALTFEDLALKPIALQRKFDITDPLFSYRDIKPPCIHCGETERISRIKENSYRCNNKECGKKFAPNDNSITTGTNCSSLIWMKVLCCLLHYYTKDQTCEFCGIADLTFYNIRNRLFYAMEILLSDLKLYGLVQCDNTFVHSSYKGSRLVDHMYPEDSPFDTINYIPRPARKRGGHHSNADKSTNNLCLFAAIDHHGHTVVRYVGIGHATATKILKAVPDTILLKDIPKKDPFPYTKHKKVKKEEKEDDIKRKEELDALRETLLVSDMEKAIEKYASMLGVNHESHVYRKNGIQYKLAPGAHDIQKANALHSRLKTFLERRRFVSSKYLPGYLTLFEFIENTGASVEAIERLFQILVTPGYGQPPEFFQTRYQVPNYYYEWQQDNILLKNASYNQVLAVYLYHKSLLSRKGQVTDPIVMRQILEETGYSSPNTVRRIYKNMASAGVVEFIYEKMSAETKQKIKSAPIKEPKRCGDPVISDFAYLFYDEYCKVLMSEQDRHITFDEIRLRLIKETGEDFPHSTLYTQIKRIEENGLRDIRLSELRSQAKRNNRERKYALTPERCMPYYEEYIKIISEYRSKNIKFSKNEIYEIIASNYDITPQTVRSYISIAKHYVQEQKENE